MNKHIIQIIVSALILVATVDFCVAPTGNDADTGVKAEQILSPQGFLAEFIQHIPPKGAHLIRQYGYYSNKPRGMR